MSPQDIAIAGGSIIGAAAFLKAALYIAYGVRFVVHKLDQIDEITQRELSHNHGTSIKDDVHGLAVSIGSLQRESDEERRRVNAVLGLAAEHHPEAAALYLALRRNL